MAFAKLQDEPHAVLLQTDEAQVAMEREGALWKYRDVVLELKPTQEGLQICLTAESTGIRRVALRWRQDIGAGQRVLGDHWERGYGDLEWRGIIPERVMPWYFLAYDGRVIRGYGVKTGAASLCHWQFAQYELMLCLNVASGAQGVLLAGRRLEAAEALYFEREGDPFSGAQAFCRRMCARPLMPSFPVYGGNNWYYAYGESSHHEIIEDSKRMAELATSAENPPFMVVDDGWQLCHHGASNGGPWEYANRRFGDMRRLAEEMKKAGVRTGIWFRPLYTAEKVPRDWVLGQVGLNQRLDPSVKGVLEMVAEDVRRIRSWGFDLIKHDFSTFDIFGRWGFQMGDEVTDDGWSFADRHRTSAEIVTEFYRVIREAAGEAIVIGCNTIGHLAAGLFEVQRSGDDTSGEEWERTRITGVNTLAFHMPQHGTFFAVDADCVGLTNRIPWEMNEQWLRLLSLSGTPLFVSLAPDACGPREKAALREAFAAAAKPLPPARPLDWLDSSCPSVWEIGGKKVFFDWTDPGRGILNPYHL